MALGTRPQQFSSSSGNDIETLFKAAELKGGAMAELAYQLQNPHESFFQRATGVASDAFRYTMKALNLGLNTVSGVASADYSIKEAIQQNIMPSDLFFGEDERLGNNWYSPENVLDGVRRFAVDTITDPLTYVSFGVAPTIKLISGTKTAAKIGGQAGAEITLSKAGQTALNKFQVSKFEALKRDFLKDEAFLFKQQQAKKGIEATADDVAKHLEEVAKTTPDEKILSGFMTKAQIAEHSKKTFANMLETNTARTEYLEQFFNKTISKQAEAGVMLTKSQMQDKIIKMSASKTDAQIAEELLGGPLDDDFVKLALGNLQKYNPDYVKTFVDKGGIKAFGKTLLSGQRIKNALNALPGSSVIDEITKPTRNLIGRAFSTSYTKEGKVSSTEMALIGKYFDMAKAEKAEAANKFINFAKKQNYTEGEMEMILAAREAFEVGDFPPIDPATREAYNLLAGKPVDYSILPERIAQGTGFLDKAYKDNLLRQRQAGIKVREIKGYMQRILVDTDIKKTRTVAKSLLKKKQLKARGIGVFTDAEGNRIAGHIEDIIDETGTTSILRDVNGKQVLKLKKHNRDLARQAIQTKVDETITTGFNKVDEIQAEIGELVADLQSSFDDKAMKAFRKHIEKIPDMDGTTKRYLLAAIKDTSPKIDVDSMIMNRLNASYADGVKMKTLLKDVSESDLNAIKERMAARKDIDIKSIEKFNESLDKILEAKKKPKTKVEGEAPAQEVSMKDLEDELKSTREAFDAKQKALLESGLDAKKISEIMAVIKADFENVIPGSARTLDGIILRKQRISDILNDVEMDRMSGIKNYQDVDTIKEGTFIDPEYGTFYQRNQAKFEEARDLGSTFETNVLSVALQNTQEAIDIAVGTHLLDDLSKSFGRVASEAPEGWRAIDLESLSEKSLDFGDFAKGANGEDIVFHPATAAKVEDLLKSMTGDETTGEIMRAFDKLQNITKASLTTIFPMFHGRNAISNAFLNHLNLGMRSLDPSLHVASGSFMKKEMDFNKLNMDFELGITSKPGTEAHTKFLETKDKLDALKKQVVFVDKNGYRWTFGEMRNTVKDRLIAFNPNITGQFDITQSQQENIQDLLYAQMPSKTIKEKGAKKLKQLKELDPNVIPLNKQGRQLASAIEDQARLVSFFGNLKDTGDIELAVAKTKQFLFDYNNLTYFEKNFLRRAMPFYTFARKNFELQVKTLFKEPGKIAQQIRAVNTIGSTISGEKPLTDEERALLPEWMRDTIAPLKSRDGKKIEIYKGVQIPIEAMYQQSTPKGIIDMTSPLLKYPVENVLGYSMYNNRPISDMTKADAYINLPKFLKDFIGYTEYTIDTKDGPVKTYRSLRPERMYALSNMPITSRVMGILNKVSDGEGWDANRAYVYTLTGIDVQDYDLEVEAARKEKEVKDKLEKALQDAGLGYTFKRFNFNKD